uniref:Cofactor of BRCA1 n=1 Tax=Syphacia muris TaxID=451379 RepID=A0A0N5A9J0_9BILA
MSSSQSLDKQWVTDIENQGVDGPVRLKHLLTTCSDPIATIKDFQEKNSIKLPTLKPAMKLLDLHNIRRTEFHEVAVNDLTELLLTKIRSLGEDGSKNSMRKLEQLLGKSFKLYRVPKFRSIVLETLKQLPKVPDRYLKIIVADKSFYNCCAVSVRQQIWLKNEALYMEAIEPVINTYIEEKRKILLNIDQSPTNFFTRETTKARRQWPQIQELVTIVGDLDVLYERLLRLIRKKFLESGDPNYCSLRMELIMAAHDNNVDSIVKRDSCHDFAWCLDACVRDKHLDIQQTNKLKNFLDSIRKASPEVVGDMAMIAADSHVLHFLCSMSVKVLRDNATNANAGHLPRELQSLQLLFRVLSIGANVSRILNAGDTLSALSIDSQIFTKFFAAMSSFIVEDILRSELLRAPDEVVDDNPIEDFLSDPDECLLNFLESDVSCALLWIHYAVEMFPSKRKAGDMPGLIRYFKVFRALRDKVGHRDPWIHLVVHRLLHSIPFDNLLANEDLATCFIDDYLLPELENFPEVKYHLLRIVHLLGTSMTEFRLRNILKRLSPKNLFEPGAIGMEADLQQYTSKYNQVLSKIAEKTTAATVQCELSDISSSSHIVVNSLDATAHTT